jgi:type IV pilus assembly protein PilB
MPAPPPATTMRKKQLLGQVVKSLGIGVHEGMIQEALGVQRKEGGQIGHILVRLGMITESQLLLSLGKQAGLEVIDLVKTPPDPALVGRIDREMAEMFGVCPVRMDGDVMIVALANPANLSVLADLRFVLNCELRPAVAEEEQIRAAIAGGKAAPNKDDVAAAAAKAMTSDSEEAVNAAPVVKLLNYIILQAVKDKASDIHLEPFEHDFKVRYRVDGVLYELEPPPPHLAIALISRVKVKAGLDIAETRLPQDGRIDMMINERSIDLRVSTLPTMFGESCVMRILDRTVVSLDLSQVGLRPDELSTFRGFLTRPHGIILVTGPTGSGKTTTLYSALNEANDPSIKIITTEDPVEYDLAGITQVQINDEIGVTYARCLRSILRQDPDMILVGEIRDKETAGIAIEAALTGHVVFSTVHTNDAPLAVTRMIDVGVEPFLLAATLEAIVAQRLVRRVCTGCKVLYDPSDEVLMELSLKPQDVVGKQFAYGKGCEICHFTGMKGRTAIFEILQMTDRLREMILDGAATDAIRLAAKEQGMRSLRDAGLLAIFDGVTTVEEVLRETIEVF